MRKPNSCIVLLKASLYWCFVLTGLAGTWSPHLEAKTDLAQDAMNIFMNKVSSSYFNYCASTTDMFLMGNFKAFGVLRTQRTKGLTPPFILVQLRKANFYAESEPISSADGLNGIEWHGWVYLFAPATRVREEDGSWADWIDGDKNFLHEVNIIIQMNSGIYFKTYVTRKHGEWIFNESDISRWKDYFAPIKVTCTEAPPIKQQANL